LNGKAQQGWLQRDNLQLGLPDYLQDKLCRDLAAEPSKQASEEELAAHYMRTVHDVGRQADFIKDLGKMLQLHNACFHANPSYIMVSLDSCVLGGYAASLGGLEARKLHLYSPTSSSKGCHWQQHRLVGPLSARLGVQHWFSSFQSSRSMSGSDRWQRQHLAVLAELHGISDMEFEGHRLHISHDHHWHVVTVDVLCCGTCRKA